jgi:hypothetical protein
MDHSNSTVSVGDKVQGKPVKISAKSSHSLIVLRLASTEGQQSMAFAISQRFPVEDGWYKLEFDAQPFQSR